MHKHNEYKGDFFKKKFSLINANVSGENVSGEIP